jgi:hypothetical protein
MMSLLPPASCHPSLKKSQQSNSKKSHSPYQKEEDLQPVKSWTSFFEPENFTTDDEECGETTACIGGKTKNDVFEDEKTTQSKKTGVVANTPKNGVAVTLSLGLATFAGVGYLASNDTPNKSQTTTKLKVLNQNLFGLPLANAVNFQKERFRAAARAICNMKGDDKPDVIVVQEMNAVNTVNDNSKDESRILHFKDVEEGKKELEKLVATYEETDKYGLSWQRTTMLGGADGSDELGFWQSVKEEDNEEFNKLLKIQKKNVWEPARQEIANWIQAFANKQGPLSIWATNVNKTDVTVKNDSFTQARVEIKVADEILLIEEVKLPVDLLNTIFISTTTKEVVNNIFRDIISDCGYEHQFYEIKRDGIVHDAVKKAEEKDPNARKMSEAWAKSGIMIASRLPFVKNSEKLEAWKAPAPSFWKAFTTGKKDDKTLYAATFAWKGFKYAEVEKDGQKFGVVGAHLEPYTTELAKGMRKHELEQVKKFIDNRVRENNANPVPTVFSADFNFDINFGTSEDKTARWEEARDQIPEWMISDSMGKELQANPDFISVYGNTKEDSQNIQRNSKTWKEKADMVKQGLEDCDLDRYHDLLEKLVDDSSFKPHNIMAAYETTAFDDKSNRGSKERLYDFVAPLEGTFLDSSLQTETHFSWQRVRLQMKNAISIFEDRRYLLGVNVKTGVQNVQTNDISDHMGMMMTVVVEKKGVVTNPEAESEKKKIEDTGSDTGDSISTIASSGDLDLDGSGDDSVPKYQFLPEFIVSIGESEVKVEA